MDRRGVLRPVEVDRRSGGDRRRVDDRRTRLQHEPVGGRRRTDWSALPPLSRLIPALIVVAASVLDLAVAQTTATHGWSWLVILAAYPVAAYDLATPRRWHSHLPVVWVLVVLYVMGATVHITWMAMR